MTQINTNNQEINTTTTHSTYASQLKNALSSTKNAVYSAGVSTIQCGREAAVYLGSKSVELIKGTPQMTRDALSATRNVACNYIHNRSSLDILFDVAVLTGGTFAAYKFISYGPNEAVNKAVDFIATPFKSTIPVMTETDAWIKRGSIALIAIAGIQGLILAKLHTRIKIR